MLDGRSIIEVPWSTRSGDAIFAGRTWVVRFGRDGAKGRCVHAATRSPHTGTWFTATPLTGPEEYLTLRKVRQALFRGNGRLTGGHPEVTHPVTAPMSTVNIQMLISNRTAPGDGYYWS